MFYLHLQIKVTTAHLPQYCYGMLQAHWKFLLLPECNQHPFIEVVHSDVPVIPNIPRCFKHMHSEKLQVNTKSAWLRNTNSGFSGQH